jgi:predicted esterase
LPAWASFLEEETIRPGGADHDSSARAFAKTVTVIHRSIDEIRARHNLPAERVAVFGYSQGAAAAAAAALTYRERLGGVGLLSGWLLKASRQRVSRSQSPSCGPGARFFVSHGTADTQVSFECAEQTTQLLGASGALVVARAFPKLEHDAGANEAVPDAMRFLDDCLCSGYNRDREDMGANSEQAQKNHTSAGEASSRFEHGRSGRSKKARSSA